MKSWELFDRSRDPVNSWINWFADSHKFLLPSLVDIPEKELAVDLLKEGVTRLPFVKCLFEYETVMNGLESKYGTLEDIDRVTFLLAEEETKGKQEFPIIINCFPLFRNKVSGWQGIFNFPIQLGTGVRSTEVLWSYDNSDKSYEKTIFEYLRILLNTLLLLSTNSLELKEVVVPEKLQKARNKAGKPPVYEFVMAKLKTDDLIRNPPIGTHSSPILHWRRGHYRRLAEDKITFVKPHLVGNVEYGFRDKSYDAKDLAS